MRQVYQAKGHTKSIKRMPWKNSTFNREKKMNLKVKYPAAVFDELQQICSIKNQVLLLDEH